MENRIIRHYFGAKICETMFFFLIIRIFLVDCFYGWSSKSSLHQNKLIFELHIPYFYKYSYMDLQKYSSLWEKITNELLNFGLEWKQINNIVHTLILWLKAWAKKDEASCLRNTAGDKLWLPNESFSSLKALC